MDRRGDEMERAEFSVIEKLGRFASLGAAGLLAISVFYDFSFLLALRLNFAEVATTMSDHLRSAIVWAPALAAGGLLGFLALLGLQVARASTGRPGRWLRGGVIAVISIALGAGGFFLWREGETGQLLFAVVIALWLVAFVLFSRRRGGLQPQALLLWSIVLVTLVAGSLGYARGRRLLTTETPRWELSVVIRDSTTTVQALGIRRFESTVVLVDDKHRVHVWPSSIVGRATLLRAPGADEAGAATSRR